MKNISPSVRSLLFLLSPGGVNLWQPQGPLPAGGPAPISAKLENFFCLREGGLNLCHLRGPLPHRAPRADFFSATRVLKTLGKSKNNQRAGLNIEITSLLEAFSRRTRELPAEFGDYFSSASGRRGCLSPSQRARHSRRRSRAEASRKNVAKFRVGG